MMHPRLSVNALSSINWSFDKDLQLWRELGVCNASLLISKIEDNTRNSFARLKAAGIGLSSVVCGSLPLRAPDSLPGAQVAINTLVDEVAMVGGKCVYFPAGRTTGAPWREVLKTFSDAVAPCVAHANRRDVRLSFEASLRTDASFVNTLRDAVDIAEITGLSLIVDFGNCWMERDLREVLMRAAPHISLVQIDDVIIGGAGKPNPGGRVHIGDGELPLTRLMQDVIDTGYQGLFDLEVLGPAIEAEGYDSALRRGLNRASSLLTEMGL